VVHVLIRTCAHIYVRYVCSFPGYSSWAGRVVIASIQRTRTSISQARHLILTSVITSLLSWGLARGMGDAP